MPTETYIFFKSCVTFSAIDGWWGKANKHLVESLFLSSPERERGWKVEVFEGSPYHHIYHEKAYHVPIFWLANLVGIINRFAFWLLAWGRSHSTFYCFSRVGSMSKQHSPLTLMIYLNSSSHSRGEDSEFLFWVGTYVIEGTKISCFPATVMPSV